MTISGGIYGEKGKKHRRQRHRRHRKQKTPTKKNRNPLRVAILVQNCILRSMHVYRMFILKNSMMARHESNESVAQL